MPFDEVVSELSSWVVTLITGPPLTGKYDLLLRMLSEPSDGVVLITTKHGATRILEDYETHRERAMPDHLGIIDCLATEGVDESQADGADIRSVNGPTDLTSIGVEFTDFSIAFAESEDAEEVGVGIHSVSQLVLNTDLEPVYKFLQVLTGQIRTAGWAGAAAMDHAPGENTTETLKHHFDNVVRVREADDGTREFRVRGRTTTDGWQPV